MRALIVALWCAAGLVGLQAGAQPSRRVSRGRAAYALARSAFTRCRHRDVLPALDDFASYEAFRDGPYVVVRTEDEVNGLYEPRGLSMVALDTRTCTLEHVSESFYLEDPAAHVSFGERCPPGGPVSSAERRLELANALRFPTPVERYDEGSPRFAAALVKYFRGPVPCPHVDCLAEPADLGMVAIDAEGRFVTRAFVPPQRSFAGVPVANPSAYVEATAWPAIRAAWGVSASPSANSCGPDADPFVSSSALLGPTSTPSRAYESETHDVYTAPIHVRFAATLVALYDHATNTHRYLGRVDGAPHFALQHDGFLIGWVATENDDASQNDGLVVVDLARSSMHLVVGYSREARILPHSVDANGMTLPACFQHVGLAVQGDVLTITSDCGASRIPFARVRDAIRARP